MRTIQVNYDEVYAKTAELRRHISANIVGRANSDYNRIQSHLRQVDGGANEVLIEVMEANRQKTLAAAYAMDKLLEFIATSAKQIEINEDRIARTINRR